MARIYLVRHGRATTTWDPADLDPPLDDLGRRQAEARAQQFAILSPLALLSSPLRRTRETAAPLERLWMTTAKIDPRVGEMQSPANTLPDRAAWLRGILQQRWPELDQSLKAWREETLQALSEIERDTVIFSHFVAINVAVGHALDDDRVTCFRPDNCSCTVLEVQGREFQVVELGSEGSGKLV